MQETDSVKILELCLADMKRRKLRKNRFTYIRSMWIYGKNKDFSTVESILNDMRTKNFPIDTVVYNMLIKVHSDASQFNRAEFYYKEMLHQHIRPDVVTYNSMMQTFSLAGDLDKVHYYYSMLKNGGIDGKVEEIRPDIYTYSTLISAFGKHGQIEKIAFYLEEMDRNSIELDIKTYNLLISLYGRNGDVENVVLYFDRLKLNGIEPDVSTFSSLMNAYANICLETVCTYFSEMKKMNLKPNVVVYTILISAHGAASQHEKIDGLLQEMKDEGIEPDSRFFNVLDKAYDGLDHLNNVDNYFPTPTQVVNDHDANTSLFDNEGKVVEAHPHGPGPKGALENFDIRKYRNTIPHLISKSVARQNFDALFLYLDQMEAYHVNSNDINVDFYNQLIRICLACKQYEKAVSYFHEIRRSHLLAPNAETKKLFLKNFEELREVLHEKDPDFPIFKS